MKFALGQIRKNAHQKPSSFGDMVDVSELETMNNDIREIKPVQVEGNYSLQGEHIIFSFKIKGEMILPCARTLVDVPYPFEISANEIFTTSDYYTDDEDEIHSVDGEVINLTPYIKENILLSTPYRVYAKEVNATDEDIAPDKGNGWEVVSEAKVEEKIDPRLKKLESLLKDKNKD